MTAEKEDRLEILRTELEALQERVNDRTETLAILQAHDLILKEICRQIFQNRAITARAMIDAAHFVASEASEENRARMLVIAKTMMEILNPPPTTGPKPGLGDD